MKHISVFFSAIVIIILGISNASALPSCHLLGFLHNCIGTFTYTDGNKYVGEWQNSQANGQGTYTWADGAKYVGEWQSDERNGQGTYTYADGSKDDEYWENNKLNGYAIKYFANGIIDKEGIFKDGELLYTQTKTLPNCPSSGYFHNCFRYSYLGRWSENT